MGNPSTELGPWHPFDEFRRERKWINFIALAIAIGLHLGLVTVIPETLVVRSESSSGAEDAAVELFLTQPEPVRPEEMRYVEANPAAPENEPDRTDQYSFRNQQAADDNPNESLLEAPNVEGEGDSQKILEGALQQAAPLEPGVYSSTAQPGEGEGAEGGKAGASSPPQVVASQPLAAPDFIRQDPSTEEGPGSRSDLSGEALDLTDSVDPEAPIDVYRPPQQPTPQTQPGEGGGGQPEAKPMPRERPRLNPELITGPLMNSRGSAAHRGTIAIDSTFSEFGEYQQQFYAALQVGWYQEIEFFQPIDTGTKVYVAFVLHKDGSISDVEVVQSTASDLAATLCENAIIKRSPFRPWTKEMVEVFGDERTLRVAFHYR